MGRRRRPRLLRRGGGFDLGVSLQFVILLALPPVALQAVGLQASYAAQRDEIAGFGRQTPGP